MCAASLQRDYRARRVQIRELDPVSDYNCNIGVLTFNYSHYAHHISHSSHDGPIEGREWRVECVLTAKV